MSKLSKFFRHPIAFFTDSKVLGGGHAPATAPAPMSPKVATGTKSPLFKSQKATEAQSEIPPWYKSSMGSDLRQGIEDGKPLFLYIPWIPEHTDALISKIRSPAYTIAPFDLMQGIEDNELRREAFSFARANPQLYRRMVARRLAPLRKRIKGVLFTFDWAPVARIIASVCEELDIPRILIPHESVFVDREKYYWDPFANASVPVADIILGWGGLQREIFLERGYPAARFHAVGAPKFDTYANYRPSLQRSQFARLFGLDPECKIILFASQPLDSQLNTRTARESQRRAVGDLLDFAEEHNLQLIVRMPPSRDDILGPELSRRLSLSRRGAIDDANCYLVTPEEALYHCDLVTSVNSTMLFEGLLLNRPALSLKYVDFTQIWEQAGIPAAVNRSQTFALAAKMLLTTSWKRSEAGMAWAADMFSNGSFDGQACKRIGTLLTSIADGTLPLERRERASVRLFAASDRSIDVVAAPLTAWNGPKNPQVLQALFGSRRVVNSANGLADIKALCSVDIFVSWNDDGTAGELRQGELRKALGRPTVVISPGLIGSDEGSGLASFLIDEDSPCYDTRRMGQMLRWLSGKTELSEAEASRATRLASRLASARLGLESPGARISPAFGRVGVRKVLVIDQPTDDPSVTMGMADASSFRRMLETAFALGADVDILVKTCRSGYLEDVLAGLERSVANLHIIRAHINPHCLYSLVDEVHVVTSPLGLEALLSGKRVRTHGSPFYAGWGLTIDSPLMPARMRSRSLADLIHAAYIRHSRYVHSSGPDHAISITPEGFIDGVEARLHGTKAIGESRKEASA